jgi:antitoxin VapB
VSLNIKNERVHELARRAASRTGKSQTSVIEEALRRYLDELEDSESDQQRRQRAEQILGEMQKLIREQGGLGMRPEDLYDPITGLPA